MSELLPSAGENVEQVVLNIEKRAKPAIIGICSTGVTETKGDDVDGFIRLIRTRHPELYDVAMVYVSTPDFKDAFQDGWAKRNRQAIQETTLERPAGAPAFQTASTCSSAAI